MFIEFNGALYSIYNLERVVPDPKRQSPFLMFEFISGRKFTKQYANMDMCRKEYEAIKKAAGCISVIMEAKKDDRAN